MKVQETPFTIIKEIVKDNYRYIEKTREMLVGNNKVLTTIKETTYNETPSFYNDGLGGTNVKTITIDDVYDYLGRFCGNRKEETIKLTEINDNGKVYTPPKPFIKSKKVTKESHNNNHSTITTYGYGTGYRNSKIDNFDGKSTITYYSYSNGMPKKIN